MTHDTGHIHLHMTHQPWLMTETHNTMFLPLTVEKFCLVAFLGLEWRTPSTDLNTNCIQHLSNTTYHTTYYNSTRIHHYIPHFYNNTPLLPHYIPHCHNTMYHTIQSYTATSRILTKLIQHFMSCFTAPLQHYNNTTCVLQPYHTTTILHHITLQQDQGIQCQSLER